MFKIFFIQFFIYFIIKCNLLCSQNKGESLTTEFCEYQIPDLMVIDVVYIKQMKMMFLLLNVFQ